MAKSNELRFSDARRLMALSADLATRFINNSCNQKATELPRPYGIRSFGRNLYIDEALYLRRKPKKATMSM